MARPLSEQADDLQRATADLVKKFQFRDRNETVSFGLSVSQAYVLRALSENGPLAMGALAAEMHLSVSTLTRVVDQLVRKALVRRSAGVRDRRVCRVGLTARGRSQWQRLEDGLVENNIRVLRGIAPDERETVIRAIQRLSSAVDVWRAEAAAQSAGGESS
jgi:DNA-binding MarR family transcriptional regulator